MKSAQTLWGQLHAWYIEKTFPLISSGNLSNFQFMTVVTCVSTMHNWEDPGTSSLRSSWWPSHLICAGELPLGGWTPSWSHLCHHFTKVWLALDGSKPDTLLRSALMSAEFRWMTPSLCLCVDRLLIHPWGAVAFPCSVCHHDWGILQNCAPDRLSDLCLYYCRGFFFPSCRTWHLPCWTLSGSCCPVPPAC